MPRKARIDAPGAVQHIIIRGIERKAIFRDTADIDTFIKRFGKIITQTSTPCYAWVLMDNHAHLLLRTGQVPVSTLSGSRPSAEHHSVRCKQSRIERTKPG